MSLLPTLRRAHAAHLVAAATLALLLTLPPRTAMSQAHGAAARPSLPPELVQLRAGLEKYQDPIVAVRDGYFSTVGCIAYPKGGGEGTMPYTPGGMGVHFLNMQLIGAPIDPLKPQVLIYEPDGNKLRLAAAEWFVPTAATGGKRPTVMGKELEGPMMGHEPLMPEGLHHYDLHVWLWKANPKGVYAPTNPAVTCPKSSYSFDEDAPKLVAEERR
jgi:hypothetical protein